MSKFLAIICIPGRAAMQCSMFKSDLLENMMIVLDMGFALFYFDLLYKLYWNVHIPLTLTKQTWKI